MTATSTPMPNPMVGAVLYDDGEINFEFRGETGEAHEYSFTNPALLERIAVLLNRAAVASKRIQTGERTFGQLAPQFGGTVDNATTCPACGQRPRPTGQCGCS